MTYTMDKVASAYEMAFEMLMEKEAVFVNGQDEILDRMRARKTIQSQAPFRAGKEGIAQAAAKKNPFQKGSTPGIAMAAGGEKARLLQHVPPKRSGGIISSAAKKVTGLLSKVR